MQSNSNRKPINIGTRRIEGGYRSGKFVIASSALTHALLDVVATQDHITRKMNEQSGAKIPIQRVIRWQRKFHEALVQFDSLVEAAAQDLGLEQFYKKSAHILIIKSNLEAEEEAAKN